MRHGKPSDLVKRVLELHDPVEPISAERLSRITQSIDALIAAGSVAHPRFGAAAPAARPMSAPGTTQQARWMAAGLALVLLGFLSGQCLTMMVRSDGTETHLQAQAEGALLDTPWRAWIK